MSFKYPYKLFQSTKMDMPLSYKLFTYKINDNNVRLLCDLLISLNTNIKTYIVLLLCIGLISYKNNKSIIVGMITFVWTIWVGYWAHFLAHNKTFLDYFADENNIFSFNPFIHECNKKFFHFHDKVHHDSKVNKNLENIIIEIIQNLIFQGIGLLCILFIKERLLFPVGTRSIICKPIILFWATYYATVHIINFNIVESEIHAQHHQNKYTNYDFDIFDIIHSSKTAPIIREQLDHTMINAIILTFIIVKYRILFDL